MSLFDRFWRRGTRVQSFAPFNGAVYTVATVPADVMKHSDPIKSFGFNPDVKEHINSRQSEAGPFHNVDNFEAWAYQEMMLCAVRAAPSKADFVVLNTSRTFTHASTKQLIYHGWAEGTAYAWRNRQCISDCGSYAGPVYVGALPEHSRDLTLAGMMHTHTTGVAIMLADRQHECKPYSTLHYDWSPELSSSPNRASNPDTESLPQWLESISEMADLEAAVRRKVPNTATAAVVIPLPAAGKARMIMTNNHEETCVERLRDFAQEIQVTYRGYGNIEVYV